MDELTLYRRDVLESMRAPLEEGVVRIARSGGAITYPCRFSLVAAMNPCACGFLGDRMRSCRCSAHQLELYRHRLSGPLLDRFDISVTMARLTKSELLGDRDGETSAVVRARVERARRQQSERYGSGSTTNASCSKSQLESAIGSPYAARAALGLAIDSLMLSGRGLDRVLRVARTLADLEARIEVSDEDIAEALSYRASDGHGGMAA